MTNRIPLLPILMLALAAPAAAAGGFEDVGALEDRLVLALDAKIGQPGGPAAPIDRRLKLNACPTRAEIDPPALGAIAIRCPALGWRIRVPLLRDPAAVQAAVPRATPVAQRVERPAPVIRRGDQVELVASRPGFSISAQAIAQDDGAPGDRVRVRLDPKGNPIYAEVVDRGLVKISSPAALN